MLPCPPEHWSRFSQLLDTAMDLPETARAAWLNGLQGSDSELRPWLTRVLGSAASVVTSDFLDAPHLADPPADGFAAGDLIGPYLLISLLGEGGMGQVWRASRGDDGPQREVALKLPYAEMLAGPFRQRFRRERDMVAALTHPNIGALYDAGVSADGHPYLALELVSGMPITEHCRATGAALERRVDLIEQVLLALSYAHSRLIVHRDIKPSNVMVTAEGQVKLLDFGIAKLLEAAPSQDTPLTQFNTHLATPGYAAPEQMENGPITVATDLFATGIVLFELCTGNRPPRPRADGEAPLASGCAAASPDFFPMARRLRGDLDAIIAKALSLDPAQRYGSADAFARDLQRWKTGQPVSARRIGWPTLAAKFVRRNKVGVALVSVLALSLIGGSAGIAWQASRAEREVVRATAIKGFLIDLFEKGDPRNGGRASQTLTARQLLDFGAQKADSSFAQDPETEIDILGTLQDIDEALDDAESALRLGARRVELARKVYGAADARVVDGTIKLINEQVFFLHRDNALALLESIREPVFSNYGNESLQRAQWLEARADALRAVHGARDEALADSVQAVSILEKHFHDDPTLGQALVVLAGYQYDAEQYEQALASMNEERDLEKSFGRFDDFDNMQYMTQAGNILQHLGRIAQAQAIWPQAEAVAERTLGRSSSWYLASVMFFAQSKHRQGNRAEAMEMFRQALGIGSGNAEATGQVTSMWRAYGIALDAEGDYATAIPILERVVAQTRKHERDEPSLRSAEGLLGDAYDQAGRAEEARPLLKVARDDWVRYGVVNGVQTLSARARWARFLSEHGDPADAVSEFNQVLRIAAGKPSVPLAQAYAGLARSALVNGDGGASDRQSAEALRVLDAVTLDYDVRVRPDLWMVRGQSLLANGHAEQAQELASRALRAAVLWDAPASGQILRAQALIAQITKASAPPKLMPGHKNV